MVSGQQKRTRGLGPRSGQLLLLADPGLPPPYLLLVQSNLEVPGADSWLMGLGVEKG